MTSSPIYSPHAQITGLILAGGRSTRMSGTDKGMEPLHGIPMVAWVIARLAPQVTSIMINANRHQSLYAQFGWPVWPDQQPDFAGPLAGLQTGLLHCKSQYLVTAPCDSPCLPTDLVTRLWRSLQETNTDLAVAVTGDSKARQPHPVCMLLRTKLLPDLSNFLHQGERKMETWYRRLHYVETLFTDISAFRNINTREELQQLSSFPTTMFKTLIMPAHTTLIDSCMLHDDRQTMTVTQAQATIHSYITPIDMQETIGLRNALDRVLACDIIAPINVPAHDNSAMDGYAFRFNDLQVGANTVLDIAGVAHAGHPYQGSIATGQAIRIMTGALMPDELDTVIAQERIISTTGTPITSVTIPYAAVTYGDNRRRAGEDLRTGSPALLKGHILHPADLGLLASLGIAEVPVQRRLRVAFFSTGDELRSTGIALEPGYVYDANRYTLYGMLQRLGCETLDMGVIGDHPALLETALRNACDNNVDVIITSGGVSTGDADHIRQTMARLGEIAFWKINLRPGRPLAFGRITLSDKSAIFFGLPGNPVAVMVSFYCFVRDALLQMMGAKATALPLIPITSTTAIEKRPGRTEYQRGRLIQAIDGSWSVRPTTEQGSGILRSMSEANCMIVLGHDQGNVAVGDKVNILLFDGLT